MTPQECQDREAIRHILATYNINGDRGNLIGLTSIFTDDIVMEFGGGRFEGREAIITRLSGGGGTRNPALTVIRHHLTTSLIDINENSAAGRTYFTVLTDIGPDHHGVYIDQFRRTDTGWLISHRTVRIDWQAENSLFAPLDVRGQAPALGASDKYS